MSTTSYDKIRAALAGYFSANWDDTAIAWPNVTFTPTAGMPWVRFTILLAGADRELITGSADTGELIYGSIVVQVFAPVGTGDGAAMALVDSVKALFKEKKIVVNAGKDPLFTFVPRVNVVGNDPLIGDSRVLWFQVNVETPFEFLET